MPSSLRTTILRYAAAFLAVYVLASLGFWAFYTWHWAPRRLQDSLPVKMARYEEHPDKYDLVFLGDSRTYCGVHPHLLDPLLGTTSVNLSSFANWFPTQYPLVQDLLAVMPRDTLVVWSVGHQNFFEAPSIRPRYPIGLANVPRYVLWGFSPWELWENIAHYNPLLQLFALRGKIQESLLQAADRNVWRDFSLKTARGPLDDAEKRARRLRREFQSDPDIRSVEITRHEGRPVSLILHTRAGSYLRMELVPEHFREMQKDQDIPGNRHVADTPGGIPGVAADKTPEPRYWKLFIAMLDLFQQHGASLVVSEFEEAPYRYRTPEARNRWRQFMRETVQPEVQRRGFGYVRVNFDRLAVQHYFDYNHLNTKGAEVFTPMLAQALKPYLPSKHGAR